MICVREFLMMNAWRWTLWAKYLNSVFWETVVCLAVLSFSLSWIPVFQDAWYWWIFMWFDHAVWQSNVLRSQIKMGKYVKTSARWQQCLTIILSRQQYKLLMVSWLVTFAFNNMCHACPIHRLRIRCSVACKCKIHYRGSCQSIQVLCDLLFCWEVFWSVSCWHFFRKQKTRSWWSDNSEQLARYMYILLKFWVFLDICRSIDYFDEKIE